MVYPRSPMWVQGFGAYGLGLGLLWRLGGGVYYATLKKHRRL